jgi:hypothetical protein
VFFFANFAKPPLQLYFVVSKMVNKYSQKAISAKNDIILKQRNLQGKGKWKTWRINRVSRIEP